MVRLAVDVPSRPEHENANAASKIIVRIESSMVLGSRSSALGRPFTHHRETRPARQVRRLRTARIGSRAAVIRPLLSSSAVSSAAVNAPSMAARVARSCHVSGVPPRLRNLAITCERSADSPGHGCKRDARHPRFLALPFWPRPLGRVFVTGVDHCPMVRRHRPTARAHSGTPSRSAWSTSA